ncbi:MAG: hypothetical protein GPJ54_17810 [Candidatus Heimdallarchaeota archaeon]|nr:hypothetical protein [Candidatus Heimdallarchaeota archaeon]
MACSWCNKIIPQNAETNQSLERSLSHTICLFCMHKMNLFDEINGSSIDNSITYGQAVIDKDNIITSYETINVSSDMELLDNTIGKDYFEEFNPTLSVKSLKYKLSGLRRRKQDGQLELQYLIKDDSNIHFSSIEMTHFKSSGNTLINMTLIKKEEL